MKMFKVLKKMNEGAAHENLSKKALLTTGVVASAPVAEALMNEFIAEQQSMASDEETSTLTRTTKRDKLPEEEGRNKLPKPKGKGKAKTPKQPESDYDKLRTQRMQAQRLSNVLATSKQRLDIVACDALRECIVVMKNFESQLEDAVLASDVPMQERIVAEFANAMNDAPLNALADEMRYAEIRVEKGKSD